MRINTPVGWYTVCCEEDFLLTMESQVPTSVVLSVPHDPALRMADFEGLFVPRTGGVTQQDLYVWPIAKDMARRVPVCAVRGLLPRPLVDYNRSWPAKSRAQHVAFVDPCLESAYLAYHRRIGNFLKAAEAVFPGRALLLDLHGFAVQPPYAPPEGYDLILGTANRQTIPHGEVDRLLAGFMRERGYRVFLPEEVPVRERRDAYDAGHIVRYHSEVLAVNAVQIEMAGRFRTKEGTGLGIRLAEDLASFLCTVV